MHVRQTHLIRANLAILILTPVAWAAPLLRAGLLPFFDLEAVSILTGLRALYETDLVLAGLVAGFAIVAPLAKGIGLHLALTRGKLPLWLSALGRLAMADIFLVALYVVLAKGVGVGRVEVGWGLYLFSFCVIASLGISALAGRADASGGGIWEKSKQGA